MTAVVTIDRPDLAAPTRTMAVPALRLVPELEAPLPVSSDITPGFVVQARNVCKQYPSSMGAHSRLAQAELNAGNVKGATDVAKFAIVLCGDDFDVPALLVAVQVLITCGERAMAEEVLSRTKDRYRASESFPAALLYASLAVARQDHEAAASRLSDVDPAHPTAAAIRGWIALREHRYEAAIRALRVASSADLLDPVTALNLGYAFSVVGSTKKATRITEVACHLAPADVTAALNLMSMYLHNGEYDEALRALARVESFRPDDLELQFAKADVLSKSNHTRKALQLLRKQVGSRRFFAATPVQRAKLKANVAVLERSLNKIDSTVARDRVLSQLEATNYASVNMAYQLVPLTQDQRDEGLIRNVISRLAASHPSERLLGLEMHASFLAGDFEVAADLAGLWLDEEPLSVNAGISLTYLLSNALIDFERAVEIGQIALRRVPAADTTRNNVAYALAMLGRADDARRVLHERPCAPEAQATEGLIELASGNIDRGRELYALAAETFASHGWAPRELVHCYQAVTEYRFGLGPRPDFSELASKLKFDARFVALMHAAAALSPLPAERQVTSSTRS